ncbi:MAG: HAD family hydrolase [Planctomycetota bacterium]|jgi:phosphoglycolate phosphatase|nr:HAD family hydrolase [Planctomycetota bacterium]
MYQSIIFDLDGTLLNTLPDLAASMNRALTQYGLPEHSLEQHRLFVGEGLQKFVERAVPRDRQNLTPDVFAAFNRDYEINWAAQTAPYPGIEALLTALTARGVKINVLSNKPHRYIAGILAHFFPRQKFAEAHGQHPDKPRKPDPWGALHIAAQLQVPPTEMLYVGDSGTDMQTAAAAQMPACGVLWGFRDEAELRANGAQFIVRQPAEILSITN